MLFNSFIFLALLLVTFIIYYLPQLSKHQIKILIVSSLAFYAYDEFWFVLLLLLSATINILTSYNVVYGKAKRKKTLALTGVIVNVLILAFFKYSPLISLTFFDTSGSVGEFLIKVPLPIGVSFFTFEGISLLIDVWKEKYTSNKNIVDKSLSKHAQHTLFFISFFPHLIAGPILKAHDFYPQIGQKLFKDIRWEVVVKNLITGYFLKMVIADNLKDFTHLVDTSYFLASITLFVLVLAYAIQMFADFGGYSLIAIGLAKMFGYDFNMNFNFPYISTSFKEFWRRWHISLSSFLMEYLYFPLGGSKKGKVRTYLNLILTMTLGGLWHGVAWSFALWGFLHGIALAIERLLTGKTRFKHTKFTIALKGIFVYLYVSAALILYNLDIRQLKEFLYYFPRHIVKAPVAVDIHLMVYSILYCLPVVIYHMMYLHRNKAWYTPIRRVEPLMYAVMLLMVFVNSGMSGSFIYFQF